MRGKHSQIELASSRFWALALALMAMLVILASGPAHALEDETPEVPAAAALHAGALADWDHHLHGHQCAGHCAAHVLSSAPSSPVLARARIVRAPWRAPPSTDGRSAELKSAKDPPRA